jgi:hypothetical protein
MYQNNNDGMIHFIPREPDWENKVLRISAGKGSFILCEDHFASFSSFVRRSDDLSELSSLYVKGNWAKNTKFTTCVVDDVCPICPE